MGTANQKKKKTLLLVHINFELAKHMKIHTLHHACINLPKNQNLRMKKNEKTTKHEEKQIAKKKKKNLQAPIITGGLFTQLFEFGLYHSYHFRFYYQYRYYYVLFHFLILLLNQFHLYDHDILVIFEIHHVNHI